MLGEEDFLSEVDIDFDGKTGKGFIKWSVSFECRKWGVKSVYTTVPDQKITTSLSYYDENDDLNDEMFELDLKDISTETPEVISIFPTDLIYKNGKWNLEFNS